MTSPLYPGHEKLYDDPLGQVVEIHAPCIVGTNAQRLVYNTTLLSISKFWFEKDTKLCYQWNGVSWQNISAGEAVTSVTGSSPIVSSGGATPVISLSGTDINVSGSVVGLNGGAMTLEGTTDRVFPPKIPFNTAAAISATSQTAYFVYLGKTVNAFIPKYARFLVITGGTESAAEVGFFSSPTAPSAASQTLTKLVSGTVTTSFTNGTVTKNTSAMATSIAAGTFLWAGFLVTATVAPTLGAVVGDLNTGMTATLAMGANTFAGTATYATTITTDVGIGTNQAPYLVASLD